MSDPAEQLVRAADRLASADKILLTCHRGPDGDSIGSMVALAALLRAQGKEATLYNPDLVPRHLKWMPFVKKLVHRIKKDRRYEVTVVVDCGEKRLLGDKFPAAEITGELVVLDHHASGRPFGDIYVCDPSAASVGVMVYRMANHLGWSIDDNAAAGLWVSLVSDTGSFRYSNTNPEALTLAARLVELGVDPGAMSERMQERRRLSKYKLLAAALQTMEPKCGGAVMFMTITHEMIGATKASWEESEGTVNYTRMVDGVECGVLFTPAKGGGVRVSMRGKGNAIDAGAVCLALGGGGHPGAAGCTFKGTIDEAKPVVEKALTEALAEFAKTSEA